VRSLIFIFGVVIIGLACNKQAVEPPITLNVEDYFPLDSGMYWIYDVQKIEIDAPIGKFDTTHFELKMLIKNYDDDIDMYEFWRYSRADSTMPWNNYDIVTVSTDQLTIQWVENNLRYVKLTNPIAENKFWDGNIYNILSPWNYYYSDFESNFENEYLIVTDVVKVNQRDVSNFLQSEKAWELYGKNVGLVFKYEEVLVLESNQPKTGYIDRYDLITFKKQ
jgi:hypothetical protein